MRRAAAASAPPHRAPRDRGARFPAERISHAVWRCSRFALRHRDVEGLLAGRGVRVSAEAIRRPAADRSGERRAVLVESRDV